MYKVNNSKLSEQNTKLMIPLANSKGSQDSLEKQLSEAVALGSFELTEEPSSSANSCWIALVAGSHLQHLQSVFTTVDLLGQQLQKTAFGVLILGQTEDRDIARNHWTPPVVSMVQLPAKNILHDICPDICHDILHDICQVILHDLTTY